MSSITTVCYVCSNQIELGSRLYVVIIKCSLSKIFIIKFIYIHFYDHILSKILVLTLMVLLPLLLPFSSERCYNTLALAAAGHVAYLQYLGSILPHNADSSILMGEHFYIYI